jgi:hypothetical protein
MMKKITRWMVSGAVVGMMGAAMATAQTNMPERVRVGGDLRLRQEYFDKIPISKDPPGVTRGGENNYFRMRTRLWTEIDLSQDVLFKVRAVNEFRHWQRPDQAGKPDNATYDFPDEVVLDNLFLEVRNLMDQKIDLRVGRQDLMYGNGMVILEGTPKDGSRTTYFNAAKLTVREIPDTTVDFLAIYNDPEDELAMNSTDRDLTGLVSGNNEMRESGGGFYLKNKSIKDLPLEVYGLYKNESDWDQAVGTNTVAHDELDVNTLGFRLLPDFGNGLSASLEAAYQLGWRGDADVAGYGVDAAVQYKLSGIQSCKPMVYSGVYILSGDDPNTKKDEGWNPLWSRFPQYSEFYVYAYDADGAARWSNLIMPNAGVKCTWGDKLTTKAYISYLWAMEDNGPGEGRDRGVLGGVFAEYVVGKGMLTAKDKLAVHVLCDVLEPGDYYKVDDLALFARWQVMYEF